MLAIAPSSSSRPSATGPRRSSSRCRSSTRTSSGTRSRPVRSPRRVAEPPGPRVRLRADLPAPARTDRRARRRRRGRVPVHQARQRSALRARDGADLPARTAAAAPWWSVGVAALAVAIPSSIYTSLVLTESAAYLTASLALLAVVLALERPTALRQLALLGAVALAYPTRPQFGALSRRLPPGRADHWARRTRHGPAPRRRAPNVAHARRGRLAGAVTVSARLLVAAPRRRRTSGATATLAEVRPGGGCPLRRLSPRRWEIYLFVVPLRCRPDRRRPAAPRRTTRFAAGRGVRRGVPDGEHLLRRDRGGVREHAVRVLRAPRPVPLLHRAALARRLRRVARARAPAAADLDGGRCRARPRPAGAPPVRADRREPRPGGRPDGAVVVGVDGRRRHPAPGRPTAASHRRRRADGRDGRPAATHLASPPGPGRRRAPPQRRCSPGTGRSGRRSSSSSPTPAPEPGSTTRFRRDRT